MDKSHDIKPKPRDYLVSVFWHSQQTCNGLFQLIVIHPHSGAVISLEGYNIMTLILMRS